MFGMEEKVAQVRQALIKALRAKSFAIQMEHADKKPEQIPQHALARSQVLLDIAEILTNLRLEKPPEGPRG